MKNLLVISLLLFSSAHMVYGDPAEELCNCLKQMKKSQTREDKNRCLVMQEVLVNKMGKGTPEYKQYKEKMSVCEKEITRAEVNTIEEPKSVEEKAKVICECANKSKGDQRARMQCMMLQDQYSKSLLPDKEAKKKFLIETNQCF